MSETQAEVTRLHTLLIQCALQVDESRTYWRHVDGSPRPTLLSEAFEGGWFGSVRQPFVKRLLANFRLRYDAYPVALRVLHQWREMTSEARRLICHWHLQLADPLYRRFTGEFLVARRDAMRVDVTRDVVTGWVEEQAVGRWRLTTCVQFASKLLSAAYAASFVGSNRDPRPLQLPSLDDNALTYLLYLLRDVQFAGTLIDNPYLASVGLRDDLLERRLQRLPALRFRQQGEVVEFGWQYSDLAAWAEATVCRPESHVLKGAS